VTFRSEGGEVPIASLPCAGAFVMASANCCASLRSRNQGACGRGCGANRELMVRDRAAMPAVAEHLEEHTEGVGSALAVFGSLLVVGFTYHLGKSAGRCERGLSGQPLAEVPHRARVRRALRNPVQQPRHRRPEPAQRGDQRR
jgi:hypothetical protein